MSKIFIITQTQDSNGDLFSEALVAFTTKEAAIRCIHNKRYQKELGLLPLDEMVIEEREPVMMVI